MWIDMLKKYAHPLRGKGIYQPMSSGKKISKREREKEKKM
jgi:hypothetical protein